MAAVFLFLAYEFLSAPGSLGREPARLRVHRDDLRGGRWRSTWPRGDTTAARGSTSRLLFREIPPE